MTWYSWGKSFLGGWGGGDEDLPVDDVVSS